MKGIDSFSRCALLFSSLLFLFACGDTDKSENKLSPEQEELMSSVAENYAEIVFANYQDARKAAENLEESIDTFVTEPTKENFEKAKLAWLAAREPYGQTEAFRFSNGPIDSKGGPEPLLNAWPLDEALIDYVRPGTGGASQNQGINIINDTAGFPEITETALLQMHEYQGNEANVTVGFHAVEFLLWGQDFADPSNGKPGQRPFTDYVSGSRGGHQNQERRAKYLSISADLIVKYLEQLEADWDPKVENNYRSEFLNLPPQQAIKNMLSGIGILSKAELSGERMITPVANGQEDEHSCFSDNTDRDIVNNALGIRNVLTGHYQRPDGTTIDGASLLDLIEEEDKELAEELEQLSEASMTRVAAIPAPFDIAITKETLENPGPIMEAVEVLQQQGDKLSESAAVLGLTISTALPE
ncbi:imelysin family protein [Halocola ammonii]